ncbi:site-2 protease family protein [bacterium]|nr:site-2 protease family protein [bacterium]
MLYPPHIPMPITLVVLLFAVVIHEYAHGWMAYLCGDSTAKHSGRLTLNPLAHIDPFMTILMPIFFYFTLGFAIGGAKPVPINPYNFRNPYKDIIKVSLAGPGSNFVLAVVFALLVWVMKIIGVYGGLLSAIFEFSVFLNLLLGMFNLIPIPPLDGSKILIAILPRQYAYRVENIGMFGIILVILFINVFWQFLIMFVLGIYRLLLWGI